MPPTINQLPDVVANKIAAGEVIERPANVVKELVENSIDAGATHISVVIEDGGRRLIEVRDNGHGMSPDDLRLALSRHATSKLRTADDLFQVHTLGFRGEALPSIAAVSEFEVASQTASDNGGHRLAIAGGVETTFTPCSVAQGTRIQVRNLFWNVPVRLKFLKTQATETAHVSDMLTRIALGHPRISFNLDADGRVAFDLPAKEALPTRIRSLFGKKLSDDLIAVDAHEDQTQLTGFIGHPSHARPTGKRQFVFLNGRHIRDKLIVAAIREGYRGFCEPRLHGSVFLHLDLDPKLVDVNVHPTKSEVRFRREKEIFHLVRGAIRQSLQNTVGGFSLLGTGTSALLKEEQTAPTITETQDRLLPAQPDVATSLSNTDRTTILTDQSAIDTEGRVQETSLPEQHYQADSTGPTEQTEASPAVDLTGIKKIIQLNDMYILIETDYGIRLVDQHALHEKALFVCLKPEDYQFSQTGTQELLVPKTIELSAADMSVIAGHLERLATVNIQVEIFGPTTLLLRSFPLRLKKLNWERFFCDLAAQGPGQDAIDKLCQNIAHSKACRSAVKAGDRLNDGELRSLVQFLYQLDHMEHCPHGRPTTLDLSWSELEKRFQR